MIVKCPDCQRRFDDEYRFTHCPHDTFAANDGKNIFRHHPESLLEGQPLEMSALRSRVSHLEEVLRNLTRFTAAEGSGGEDTELVGLAMDSVWGPAVRVGHDPYELAEAVERWLRERCGEALADA